MHQDHVMFLIFKEERNNVFTLARPIEHDIFFQTQDVLKPIMNYYIFKYETKMCLLALTTTTFYFHSAEKVRLLNMINR